MKKLLLLCIALYTFASSYNQNMLKSLALSNHNQESFSFAVMGDNRDGDNVLKKIISLVNADQNISFSINNGDLVPDGYKKEFSNYLSLVKTSNKPLLSIIGNHEIPWYDGETNYKKVFGKTHFAFSYGNSYFIVLDSSNKTIKKKQKKWLIKQLKISQQYANRFIFTHVPLYDPREGDYAKGHSFKSLKEAKKLNDIFDKYRVTMLFCSHIHFYFKGKWQKTPFVITGGAGAPLKSYKNSGFYNYVKIVVDGSHVKYKVIKVDVKAPGFIEQSIQSAKDVLNLN
ncbi:MAG: metallophosphoesterase [Sulfurospirillum sp.]